MFWNEISEQETLKQRIMKIEKEKINKVTKNRINKRQNKNRK